MSKDKIITQTLLELGISPNCKGYYYLAEAIKYMLEKNSYAKMTVEVYPAVAEVHGTSKGCVERSIRHSITSGWPRHNRELAREIFGNCLQSDSDQPTNSLFITAFVNWYKYNQD